MDYDDYGFEVTAPPNAPDWRIDALRRLFATALPFAASAPAAYKHEWLNVAEGNAVGEVITVCYYAKINDHSGVACEYGNERGAASISDDNELKHVISDALPSRFHVVPCPPEQINWEKRRPIACFRDDHTTVWASQMRWAGYTFSLDFLDDRAPPSQEKN